MLHVIKVAFRGVGNQLLKCLEPPMSLGIKIQDVHHPVYNTMWSIKDRVTSSRLTQHFLVIQEKQ